MGRRNPRSCSLATKNRWPAECWFIKGDLLEICIYYKIIFLNWPVSISTDRNAVAPSVADFNFQVFSNIDDVSKFVIQESINLNEMLQWPNISELEIGRAFLAAINRGGLINPIYATWPACTPQTSTSISVMTQYWWKNCYRRDTRCIFGEIKIVRKIQVNPIGRMY